MASSEHTTSAERSLERAPALAIDESSELIEESLDERAESSDVIDTTVSRTSTQRRKGLVAVIGVLCSLLLMLGVITGYLDADAMGKCGECLRAVTSSTSSMVELQNGTYIDESLRAIVD